MKRTARDMLIETWQVSGMKDAQALIDAARLTTEEDLLAAAYNGARSRLAGKLTKVEQEAYALGYLMRAMRVYEESKGK